MYCCVSTHHVQQLYTQSRIGYYSAFEHDKTGKPNIKLWYRVNAMHHQTKPHGNPLRGRG